MKRALITGITSQDGSYLAEHLLDEGYKVWGFVHGKDNPRTGRVRLLGDIRLILADLLDLGSVLAAVERVQPDEVYNLAAVSYIPTSWQHAELTAEMTGLGVLRVLEAIRVYNGLNSSNTATQGQTRFFQASSSEIFGSTPDSPQSESTRALRAIRAIRSYADYRGHIQKSAITAREDSWDSGNVPVSGNYCASWAVAGQGTTGSGGAVSFTIAPAVPRRHIPAITITCRCPVSQAGLTPAQRAPGPGSFEATLALLASRTA